MVSSKDKPNNHPIYVVDTNLGSIFYNDINGFGTSHLAESPKSN